MRWFLLLALLLQGCGFQPRGSIRGLSELSPLYITGRLSASHPFRRDLQQRLLQAGIELAQSPEQAQAVLRLHDLKKKVAVLSVNESNRALEYTSTQKLRFSLEKPPGTLRIERAELQQKSLTYLPGGELLGRIREAKIQEKDAYQDLIQQLFYRLEAVKK